MSTHKQKTAEERVVEELEKERESLERVANSDTAFAPRAEAALEWLAEHSEGDDDGE